MNKVLKLEALLTPGKFSATQKKEYAAKLELPENDQEDLLFMSAILVSTGTNKNGATFLGSELIKAKDSIKMKALDYEHEEDKIIGHIVSDLYFDQEGEAIDSEKLYAQLHKKNTQEDAEDVNKLIASLDATEMDIGIVCVVYKDRFPKIAKEIQEDQWMVSMECYYKDFDLKIGDKIVKKDSLKTANLDNLADELQLVVNGTSYGNQKASRVLRDISFCGCGIVKNPANDRSFILEAARSKTEDFIKPHGIVSQKEAATLELQEEDIYNSPLPEDNAKKIMQSESNGYIVAKSSEDKLELIHDSFTFNYTAAQQEAIERSSTAGPNEKYFIMSMNSLFSKLDQKENLESSTGVLFKVNDIGRVKEIIDVGGKKEEAGRSVTRFNDNTDSAGLCVNFKKYVFERQNSVPQGKLLATHWCSLFNAPCPVLGANAQDKACLRNKYARMTPVPYYNQWYTKPSAYNPSSPIPAEEIEILNTGDLPSPPSLQTAVEGKLEYENMEGLIGDANDVQDNPPAREDQDVWEDSPHSNNSDPLDPEDISSNPLPVNHNMVSLEDPYLDFPVQVRAVSISERASLKDEQFAIPLKRKYPIHTPELVKGAMSYYPNLCKNLASYSEKRELFINILKAAIKFGECTKEFEKNSLFKVQSGKDFDEEYAVPRLKLLPLNSKAQVLAAISRYPYLKAEDMSLEERSRVHINILRAASKFNINTEKFRNRLNS